MYLCAEQCFSRQTADRVLRELGFIATKIYFKNKPKDRRAECFICRKRSLLSYCREGLYTFPDDTQLTKKNVSIQIQVQMILLLTEHI